MAEFATATVTAGGSIDQFMQAFQIVVARNGWTLHDALSNTAGARDLVFRSSPMDAIADNRCYLRVKQYSLTTWGWNLYTDWDTGTHTGANPTNVAGAQNTWNDYSGFLYKIRVNEWSVMFVIKQVSYQHDKGYAGFVRRPLRNSRSGLTRTTSPYAIGTSTMAVASDMTSRMKIGQRVLVYNNSHSSVSANFSNAEVLKIQSIASGSITFTTNSTKAYDSGAVIGQLAFNGVCSAVGNTSLSGVTNYMPFELDGTRTGPTNHVAYFIESIPFTSGYGDSQSVNKTDGPGFTSMFVSTASKTGLLGYPWHLFCTDYDGSYAQAEDIFDDGDYQWVGLDGDGFIRTLMGPTN